MQRSRLCKGMQHLVQRFYIWQHFQQPNKYRCTHDIATRISNNPSELSCISNGCLLYGSVIKRITQAQVVPIPVLMASITAANGIKTFFQYFSKTTWHFLTQVPSLIIRTAFRIFNLARD